MSMSNLYLVSALFNVTFEESGESDGDEELASAMGIELDDAEEPEQQEEDESMICDFYIASQQEDIGSIVSHVEQNARSLFLKLNPEYEGGDFDLSCLVRAVSMQDEPVLVIDAPSVH